MMYIFYGDDTYAKTSADDKTPRLHLFGGVYISKTSEDELINIIRDEKSKYTHPNLPIKWNFKDISIKKKYEQFDRLDEYQAMLVASNDWRRNIITKSLGLDYKIICGVAESYSKEKDKIKKSKKDLLKYTFENVLIQVGFDAKNNKNETFVILDWPPDGDPQPFIKAFYKLYHTGTTSADRPAYCGNLSDCNFYHSLLFAKCNHSPILQFSDLIIGSMKDFLESKLNGKEHHFANEIFDFYKGKIRSKNSNIINFGLILSSGNNELNDKISKIVR